MLYTTHNSSRSAVYITWSILLTRDATASCDFSSFSILHISLLKHIARWFAIYIRSKVEHHFKYAHIKSECCSAASTLDVSVRENTKAFVRTIDALLHPAEVESNRMLILCFHSEMTNHAPDAIMRHGLKLRPIGIVYLILFDWLSVVWWRPSRYLDRASF